MAFRKNKSTQKCIFLRIHMLTVEKFYDSDEKIIELEQTLVKLGNEVLAAGRSLTKERAEAAVLFSKKICFHYVRS